jgi:hypothetical protein
MAERLMQQRRVEDEGLRVVNSCCRGRTLQWGNTLQLTVPGEEATANYVPAAAVIRRWRALSGFIGRKGRVGGPVSRG